MASQRTSQHTLSQRLKLVAGTVLVCAGLAMLPGQQNEPASLVTSFISTAVWRLVGLLPSFVPAAWHMLQGYVLDPFWSSLCLIHSFVSCMSLLRLALGAA